MPRYGQCWKNAMITIQVQIYIPGDPCKCDELVFLITLKVVKIEPNYWVEKKQNFIRFFSIPII